MNIIIFIDSVCVCVSLKKKIIPWKDVYSSQI